MMKIRPGAMFGIAVPIAGEVRLIPLRNKYWKTSLHNNGNEKEKQQRCIMFQKYEEPKHKKESKKLLRTLALCQRSENRPI